MSSRRLDRSITIRLDAKSARAVRLLAQAERKTSSQVVRELIEKHIEGEAERPSAYERTRALLGSVRSGRRDLGSHARELLDAWTLND